MVLHLEEEKKEPDMNGEVQTGHFLLADQATLRTQGFSQGSAAVCHEHVSKPAGSQLPHL